MRPTFVGFAICAFALLVGRPVHAGIVVQPLGGETPTVSTTAPAGGAPPSVASGCVWEWYEQGDTAGISGSGYKYDGLFTSRMGREICPAGPLGHIWVTIRDDGFYIHELYVEARGRVPRPLPEFSPPLTPWQFRNHPMQFWFSDAQLSIPPLTAVLPSGAGVTMSPRVAKVEFSPGNGEAKVACEKPRPTVKGDCSYKYPETSKDAPNLTFPAQILMTWEYPYVTTGGRSTPTVPDSRFATNVGIKVAKVMAIRA